MAERTQYVYGPVPSRRLGRSLGVDLIPFKTCTYDCVYCQLGPTTERTLRRAQYVPVDRVVSAVRDRLAALETPPDTITLAGSGEPTLHAGIGDLVAEIKRMTDVPVTVLTNGSLLSDRSVAEAIMGADLVVPSLDAGSEALWRYVNRPHPDLSFETMLAGLATFAGVFPGRVWLEVMLLSGVTAIDAEVRRIADLVAHVPVDRVQLNTAVRPAAEAFALPVTRHRLEELAGLFDPPAEVVADFREAPNADEAGTTPDDVLTLLRRRPCTAKDVADGLGIRPNEAIKLVDTLTGSGRAVAVRRDTGVFYKALEE